MKDELLNLARQQLERPSTLSPDEHDQPLRRLYGFLRNLSLDLKLERLAAEAAKLAVEAAETLKLPCIGGSDARKLDELGRAATFFKRPIETQAELVARLLAGECWAVQMGDLPRLSRPGEAREAEKRGKKKRRRRF